MNRSPYVWIVNEAGHDYSRAESYGELKPLTVGDINPLQLDRLSYHLTRGVVGFTDAEDYLLISGTPVVNAVALHIWLVMHKMCKVLQWNAKRRDYELTELSAEHLANLLDTQLRK